MCCPQGTLLNLPLSTTEAANRAAFFFLNAGAQVRTTAHLLPTVHHVKLSTTLAI